jgi:hypothetical protein
MTHEAESAKLDKHEPHVFQEVDLLPMSRPFTTQGVGPYTPPATPGGKSQVCGLCRKPREDRIHIEGEAEADAESPNWG